MTGRIVRSADFERVLSAVAKSRTEHFAVHHLPGCPSLPPKPPRLRPAMELSTEGAPLMVKAVDDFSRTAAEKCPEGAGLWFGMVVPKRHARRSVTRSLFKRQIRAAIGRHAHGLAGGLWIVRLRAPFGKAEFPSAASSALQRATRDELDGLLAGAMRRVGAR